MSIATAVTATRSTSPSVTIDAPDVLEVPDLGKVLRLKDHAVYALNASGNGPRPFRAGRKLRWLRSEVERWIAEQMENATSNPGAASTRPDLDAADAPRGRRTL